MTQEGQDKTFEDQLESLRSMIGEAQGLADKVDEVSKEAMNMDIGDVRNFDAGHSNLRVERTDTGFVTKLEPKMTLREVFQAKGLEFPEK